MEFAKLSRKGSTRTIDFSAESGISVSNLFYALTRGMESKVEDRADEVRKVLVPEVLALYKGYTLTVRKEYANGASDETAPITLDQFAERLDRQHLNRATIDAALKKLKPYTDPVTVVHTKGDGKTTPKGASAPAMTGAQRLIALAKAAKASDKPKGDKPPKGQTTPPAPAPAS